MAPGASMQRLAEILDHAVKTVPYYSALGQRHGAAIDLADFPLVGKRQYVERIDDLLSTAFADWPRTTDPHAVSGPRCLLCEFTSGSSGYPLRCYKTPRERSQLALSLLRKRRAIDPNFSMDAFFGFIHNTGYRATGHFDGLGNLADHNIEKVLIHLRDAERPAYLHGNPMLLLYYADFIRRNDFDLRSWNISFIESVSESLSDEERHRVADAFRTKVVDCYGCLECYNVAYECSYGRKHLNENVKMEIVDPESGRELTATGEQGEVVLTSLVNKAQPFIRYKTGDLARLVPAQCPCGNSRPIVHLSGHRRIDYIKLLFTTADTGLTICGYDIFASVMFRLVSSGHDYVEWYNVIQKELDLFEVLYIPRPRFSRDFFTLFRRETDKEIGHPVRLEFTSKSPEEVLLINRKNRVFRSLLQAD